MASIFRWIVVVVATLLSFPTTAQTVTMEGMVLDRNTNQPMPNVNIINTFTERGLTTDSTGRFRLEVARGHLVTFSRIGYKIERIRIESTDLPYYAIAMKEGDFDLPEVNIYGDNYRLDSIEKSNTYKWAIEHYKLEGMDVINHPFDALSKRNRQIWAFQKHYQYFEQEKFVTYVFNEKLIRQLTEISDSTDMLIYQQQYRPAYQQINSWSEYEFYNYIKQTGKEFMWRRRSNR